MPISDADWTALRATAVDLGDDCPRVARALLREQPRRSIRHGIGYSATCGSAVAIVAGGLTSALIALALSGIAALALGPISPTS